jgi:drug/metabolite transporter (DMT)-like permease
MTERRRPVWRSIAAILGAILGAIASAVIWVMSAFGLTLQGEKPAGFFEAIVIAYNGGYAGPAVMVVCAIAAIIALFTRRRWLASAALWSELLYVGVIGGALGYALIALEIAGR